MTSADIMKFYCTVPTDILAYRTFTYLLPRKYAATLFGLYIKSLGSRGLGDGCGLMLFALGIFARKSLRVHFARRGDEIFKSNSFK